MASLADTILSLALRRVRLLTVIVLIGVPWLLLAYDPPWQTTFAALVALIGGAAILWLCLSRRAGGGKGT